ncbi:hypothetical protein H0H93_005165, partial [Arthromyces matolae]
MPSTPYLAPLAERADIHKSCKSLETLLGVFNDYCEAAGSIVLLQKRLAKALRETAGMKTTGEIAANTLNASATIFEVSADIDSKFAKIADKEYDALSSDVKKWFKKLAKEEKIHDDRISNANAKIKQAGQIYEKKSKKNPRDATEEHSRYINLISTLGPEISQEKHILPAPLLTIWDSTHSLNVTQRHTATTYNAASCLSRVADAEWLKTCESIRRYSPAIGALGEWRALCEGGWLGPVPSDLPDIDASQHDLVRDASAEKSELEEPRTPLPEDSLVAVGSTERLDLSNQSLQGQDQLWTRRSSYDNSAQGSPVIANHHSPSIAQDHGNLQRNHLAAPPPSYNINIPKESNMDSVRTLSAFPLPPTHFPIPPRRDQGSQSQSSQSSTSYANIPRLTESPLPTDVDGPHQAMSGADSVRTAEPLLVQEHEGKTVSSDPRVVGIGNILADRPAPFPQALAQSSEAFFKPQVQSTGQHNRILSPPAEQNPWSESSFDEEFGVKPSNSVYREANATYPPNLQTTERSGSIVAVMRNRYQENTSPSPSIISPRKAVRRLSDNINDLTSRYQSIDGPSSGARESISRQLPILPTPSSDRQVGGAEQLRNTSRSNDPAQTSPRAADAVRRQQQRLDDLARLELHEKELALRRPEHESEQQKRLTTETEREMSSKELSKAPTSPSAYSPLRPRERKLSSRTQLSLSHASARVPPTSGSESNTRYPYRASNPVTPSPPLRSPYIDQYSRSQSSLTQSPQTSSSTSSHAPYCGCAACSASKYGASQSPPRDTSLRPVAEPLTLRPPEKKSNWMRRLSMPVGNILNLDSKKNASQQSLVGAQGRGGVFSLDGKKNA